MARIKDEKQYKAILGRIDEIFFQTDEKTSPEDPRLLELDLLSSMVEEYEKEHFPIETPSLPDMLVEKMGEYHVNQKEMASLLGMTASRLCDILNRKKTPTYRQAQTIASKLDISPAIVLNF